jgi:hypothetical protein
MAGASVELGLGELEDVQVAPPYPLLPSEEAAPAAAAIHPRWRKGRRRRVSGRCRHPGHSDALAGGDAGPKMGDRRYNVDACIREGRGWWLATSAAGGRRAAPPTSYSSLWD